MIIDDVFDFDWTVGSFFELVFDDVVFEFDDDIGVLVIFWWVFVQGSFYLKVRVGELDCFLVGDCNDD